MNDSHGTQARPMLLPGIVAVVFVAMVFGYLWYQSREPSGHGPQPIATSSNAPSVPDSSPPAGAARPPEVDSFLAFAQGRAPEVMALDHGYTSEGLRRLAAALAAVDASRRTAEQVRSITRAADELAADPRSLRHAGITREAFLAAAQALGSPRVRLAAEALSADEPMRSQKERVERFFDEAAAALSSRPHASAA